MPPLLLLHPFGWSGKIQPTLLTTATEKNTHKQWGNKQRWMFSQPSCAFYSRGEKNLNLIKRAGIDLIVATVCWWLMIDGGFLDCRWEVRSKITTPGFFFSISYQSFFPFYLGNSFCDAHETILKSPQVSFGKRRPMQRLIFISNKGRSV